MSQIDIVLLKLFAVKATQCFNLHARFMLRHEKIKNQTPMHRNYSGRLGTTIVALDLASWPNKSGFLQPVSLHPDFIQISPFSTPRILPSSFGSLKYREV